jgi:hypothetical protein
MRKPRLTDEFRFPHGPYVRSESTDIKLTIAREKERLKSLSNVISIRKAGEPNQTPVLGRTSKGTV